MILQDGRYVVVRTMNDHDAMTVRDPARNATFQLIGLDRGCCKETLEAADIGDVFEFELRRIKYRGDVRWVEAATPVGERTNSIAVDPESTGQKQDV